MSEPISIIVILICLVLSSYFSATETAFSTIIGNNLVNILSASLATILFTKWLGENTGPTVSTVILTIIVLIFGEITPKSVSKEHPEAFAMFAAPFIKFSLNLILLLYLGGDLLVYNCLRM